MPLTRTSKWRCGPDEFPVEPTSDTVDPARPTGRPRRRSRSRARMPSPARSRGRRRRGFRSRRASPRRSRSRQPPRGSESRRRSRCRFPRASAPAQAEAADDTPSHGQTNPAADGAPRAGRPGARLRRLDPRGERALSAESASTSARYSSRLSRVSGDRTLLERLRRGHGHGSRRSRPAQPEPGPCAPRSPRPSPPAGVA